MAIGAAQRVDMATAVLVAAAVSSFLSLINASIRIVLKATRISCHFGDFRLTRGDPNSDNGQIRFAKEAPAFAAEPLEPTI
jgi:hypothetical protein